MRIGDPVAVVLGAMCLVPGSLHGQARPATSPGTLSGIVTDAAGARLPGSSVFYGDDRASALTDASGAFRFTGVAPGQYSVTARHIGYVPQSRQVTVSDSGETIHFALVAVARTLPAAVTSARQAGVSGVVTDTASRPISGVLVEIVGRSGGTVETDSAGQYHLNASDGPYFIRASRDGYRSSSVSLAIPRDEGRVVTFRLIPDSAYPLVRERAAAILMHQRLAVRSPSRSRLFTRADIERLGVRDLDDLVRRSGLMGTACVGVIDGGPEQAPTWAFALADVEYVELYEGDPRAVPRAAPGSAPASRAFGACRVTAYVWLRR